MAEKPSKQWNPKMFIANRNQQTERALSAVCKLEIGDEPEADMLKRARDTRQVVR